MDPSSWSPYSQQPFTHGNGGSPQSLILPPTPSDDTLNSYGSANPHPLLMSPCPGLQPMPPRPNTADPAVHPSSQLLNSHYEPTLLTPPVRSSKETPDYFNENLYNGVCKENNTGIQDFVPSSSLPSRTDSMGCLPSENSNFNPQPVSFQASADIDKPSPGPFGVLPHEAVMTRPNRYDRNKDKFVSPASKPVSFNNVPYPEQDVSSVYTSTPLSTHSVFSNDNASRSPIVNSVTSPNMSNFSSPSDYYSSPKNNFGAYNNLQSPVPQSPSVAQHSYPNSPFTNLDPVSHISSAPPCSPMSSGTYVNKLSDRGVIGSQVPQRNGQKSQHSPSNMTGGNSVICYPQPSQGMVHHGHQPPVSKTSDYHSDYVFPHNHVSPSSYPSVFPAIHSSQMACDDPSMTPRPHGPHPNMPHDNRMQYPHSSPLPPSSMENSSYLPGKGTTTRHDMMYNSCSGLPSGQNMHPSSYQDCPSVIDSMRSHSMHPHHSHPHHANAMMPSMMSNDRQYGYPASDMNDEKNALDMFNSHVDSGVHNPDNCQSSISFLDGDLQMLEPDVLTNRDMRLAESNPPPHPPPPPPPPLSAMNMENSDRGILTHSQMSNYHHNIPNTDMSMKNNVNYPYCSNADVYRGPGNMTFNSLPRKRGRRGRRRKADINSSNTYCQYQSYKNDRNSMYNNGYQLDHMKFPEYRNDNCYNSNEYRNNNCFSNYSKSYKERLDAYEFHATYYAPSKYQSLRKRDENSSQNCIDSSYKRPKRYLSVEDDLRFLGDLKFPVEESKDSPHTFMKTRNKDSEGFLQCYKNFLEVRKTRRSDDEDIEVVTSPKEHRPEKEHKEKRTPKHLPKLTIKLGRCNNPGEWRLTETHFSPERYSDSSDESASTESAANSASQKAENISTEGKTREKSKSTGQYCEIEKPPPKKRGRKAKNPELKHKSHHSSRSSTSSEDPLKKLPYPIKEEVLSDVEEQPTVLSIRRSSLRSQRTEPDFKEEPKPGPSIKIEPPDISSDEVDVVDDSDSDPVWTPSARVPKLCDPTKSHPVNVGVKRQRRKYTRRSSSAASGPVSVRRRRGCHNDSPRRSGKDMAKAAICAKKGKFADAEVKVKTEKKVDFFVLSKADLGREKPPIWRVDTEMNMLQRFDHYEEQGHQIHRNTYTYAAWNNATETQYLKVNVKVLSFSKVMYVVKYLGLDEFANQNDDPSFPCIKNPLRENFEVFLQALISQALDPNFLSEVSTENDHYFLNNVKEVEKVTNEKKALLVRETWDKELQKCSELYPCINILPRTDSGESKCQICKAAKSEKLVQFYGPPYDSTTLGSTESPLSSKTQFHVCAICSSTISLYSRLHHQKYNFFVKCRTKMGQLRSDKNIESHVLLEECLRDSTWVNMLFHELEEVWKECDRMS